MKASDLMIGDWVYGIYEGIKYPSQVKKLDYDVLLSCAELPEDWDDDYEFDEIEPIPLTEDILKKNDFKWLLTESKSITYCINEPTIHVTYYKDSQEWLICVGPSGSIKKRFVEVSCVKYVHELQHALRLCGINKEIVL